MEWHSIEPKMQVYIQTALHITASLLATMKNATVDAIAAIYSPALLAKFPQIEQTLITAIGMLMDIETGNITDLKALVVEFIQWLETKSALARNATLLKLASIIVGLLDNGDNQEADYDKAVQDHVTRSKISGTPLLLPELAPVAAPAV